MNEFLKELKAIRTDVDFEHEDRLVESGILASFDIIQIVMMIESVYEVKVPVTELKPNNFNSATAMYEMVQRLEDE